MRITGLVKLLVDYRTAIAEKPLFQRFGEGFDIDVFQNTSTKTEHSSSSSSLYFY